ncbi:MAG TPA: heme-binding domain-containing protein [Roseiflexaceae bacterium]|nr:heme-binding domain-containing protein [Roseiflexaceae bacterium]
MRITARKLVVGGLGLFLAAQLVPVWLLQTNPPGRDAPPWDSPQTEALARRACFDCHSNETSWPLHSRIAPSSWLVTRHVLQGREALNFSEWRTLDQQRNDDRGRRGRGRGRGGDDDIAEDAAELIDEGEMPPSDYLLLHPEARLSEAEKQRLIQGLEASLR